eukprot:Platyproteum_vivax@DN16204_c0_g1_i1.p1
MSNIEKHLVVFDWDDTLFPSFYFHKKRVLHSKSLMKIDFATHQLLKATQLRATVKIVTNATSTWLKKTLSMLPNTKKLVKKTGIDMISARDENPKMPPHIAKTPIFHRLLKGQGYKKLTSIGDGVAEYVSAHIMKAYYDISVQVCTIAPKQNPSQLQKTLINFLHQCILQVPVADHHCNPLFNRLSTKIFKNAKPLKVPQGEPQEEPQEEPEKEPQQEVEDPIGVQNRENIFIG